MKGHNYEVSNNFLTEYQNNFDFRAQNHSKMENETYNQRNKKVKTPRHNSMLNVSKNRYMHHKSNIINQSNHDKLSSFVNEANSVINPHNSVGNEYKEVKKYPYSINNISSNLLVENHKELEEEKEEEEKKIDINNNILVPIQRINRNRNLFMPYQNEREIRIIQRRNSDVNLSNFSRPIIPRRYSFNDIIQLPANPISENESLSRNHLSQSGKSEMRFEGILDNFRPVWITVKWMNEIKTKLNSFLICINEKFWLRIGIAIYSIICIIYGLIFLEIDWICFKKWPITLIGILVGGISFLILLSTLSYRLFLQIKQIKISNRLNIILIIFYCSSILFDFISLIYQISSIMNFTFWFSISFLVLTLQPYTTISILYLFTFFLAVLGILFEFCVRLIICELKPISEDNRIGIENDSENPQMIIEIPEEAIKLFDRSIHKFERCNICQELFIQNEKIYILTCHETQIFHTNCLENWIVNKNECPNCRKRIEFQV